MRGEPSHTSVERRGVAHAVRAAAFSQVELAPDRTDAVTPVTTAQNHEPARAKRISVHNEPPRGCHFKSNPFVKRCLTHYMYTIRKIRNFFIL